LVGVPRSSLGALALLAVVILSCSSSTPRLDPTTVLPTPVTPAVTPSRVTSQTCPVRQDVCDTATDVADSLHEGDIASLVSRFETQLITCPGSEPSGLGEPFPLCDGAEQGEQREGIFIGRGGGEGSAISLPELEARLSNIVSQARSGDFDIYGGGELRQFSFGCLALAAGLEPDCRQQVTLIFSSIQDSAGTSDPFRQLMSIELNVADGLFRPWVMFSIFYPPEIEVALLGGTTDQPVTSIFLPSGHQNRGVYLPWSP
jgi:hypothetical protein